jgi:hypothetical protein
MKKRHTFKFLDDDLNRQFIALMKKTDVPHHVGRDGTVHYSSDDEVVENEAICSIRDRVFPSWQVLTCPRSWIGSYRTYMSQRRIPFHEELSNGDLWFLLPRKYRPHMWKLDAPPKKAERVAL